MANKIGKRNADGSVEYPEVSISGQPYSMSGLTMTGLTNDTFVVLDIFPQPGFDVNAEIAKLRGEPKVVTAVDNSTGETVVVPAGMPDEVKKKAP